MENVLRTLMEVAEGWGLEQVVYAFLLTDSSEKLSREKYFAVLECPSEEDIRPATMVHFGGKLRHWQYFRRGKAVIEELAGCDRHFHP
jgi:hypothetical protein